MSDIVGRLKNEAKAIAAKAMKEIGLKIPHSKTLEMVARRYGYKDWNTLIAIARENPTKVEEQMETQNEKR